jgi:hypothetical protein
MSSNVNFHIKAGLPFKKTIVVNLPTGRDWWLASEDFEVRFQIREGKSESSALIIDMLQFCTIEFEAPDKITVFLVMTGADTRLITKSGYYDIIVSDVLTVDARAYSLVKGAVTMSNLISAATEAS